MSRQQEEKKLGTCTLEGETVRLEPLRLAHAEALVSAGHIDDWTWLSKDLSTLEAMKEWINEALKAQEDGQQYPFTVVHKPQDRIVGSTRYMDIREEAKGVEIGGTWYSPSVWGTTINPETKYLLLQHAFESWGAIRVQIKTDIMNTHSQNAILKLGAKFEGQLRNHMIRRDGSIRHTMMYSITIEEWAKVKANLQKRLETL